MIKNYNHISARYRAQLQYTCNVDSPPSADIVSGRGTQRDGRNNVHNEMYILTRRMYRHRCHKGDNGLVNQL